jgi:hypothetical protein
MPSHIDRRSALKRLAALGLAGPLTLPRAALFAQDAAVFKAGFGRRL